MVDWTLERARKDYRQEHQGAIIDVNELQVDTPEAAAETRSAHPKLDRAKEQGRKTVDDCRALAEGLNAKMLEIGEVVKSANRPHGLAERLYAGLGSAGVHWADNQFSAMRHDRIRHLDLAAAVKEIQHYTEHTIKGLGETENDYRFDLSGYEKTISSLLAKQKEANPLYLAAVKHREELESQVKAFEPQLATCSQEDRPEVERKYESLKRELESAAYEEKTTLATLHEAQRALPVIQESRDAAALAIQSIHAMRQGSLEKFVNFRFMLERATTALKAQARIEEFLATDPAFNAMITDIGQNNVTTAGASLEAWADRARKAAVDPELARKMVEELLAHVDDARNDLLAIEGQVTQGERLPLIQAREKVLAGVVKETGNGNKALSSDDPVSLDDESLFSGQNRADSK